MSVSLFVVLKPDRKIGEIKGIQEGTPLINYWPQAFRSHKKQASELWDPWRLLPGRDHIQADDVPDPSPGDGVDRIQGVSSLLS